MKRQISFGLLIIALAFSNMVTGQLTPIKSFDFSLLEGKKLFIPTYEASQKFIAKMAKKGKLDEIEDAKAAAENYNKMWSEAMAESSYDATDYEIKAFDAKSLMKAKDKEAMFLRLYQDDYGNRTASITVCSPKKQVIASTIINGLYLGDKNDIRLMINMLNESLNTAAEIQDEGGSSRKDVKSKYKENVITFYDGMKDKTFLVPESTHKNEKKRTERNADLKIALKSWKLSNYEMTTEEVIEEKRVEGDESSFYWRDFPIYTNSPLLTYHYNVILSCEGDDVLFGFLGKKRLKPATLEQIQTKIVNKAEKYKTQLGK